MGQLLALALGVIIGASVVASALGLAVSALLITVFLAMLLIQRRWVPLIYNVRSLGVRKVTTGVTALGLALVVYVFATVLMLSNGISRTLAGNGLPENVKVLRKGSLNEIQSNISPEQVRLMAAQPEVALAKDGQPLASSELVVVMYILKKGAKDQSDGTNLTVRGVGPRAVELHPEIKITEGRTFTPGTSEIILGRSIIGGFENTTLGGTMHFGSRDWKVVGIFEANRTAYQSEVWGDVDQFMDAFHRRPDASSVNLRLKDANAWRALAARTETDPQLNTLEVHQEIDYWAKQSEGFAAFIKYLGLFVSIIFAFGAVLGAMITMYAQVAARTREIGTLRALGFGRHAVLVSFVVESTLLALVSGLVGLAGASFMRFASFSAMNFASFSEVSFRFDLTPDVITATLIFAGLMGYAGGLLPALRAALMPIVKATRGG
jgi:ABC-type lipoprotein release transport system permease subunit